MHLYYPGPVPRNFDKKVGEQIRHIYFWTVHSDISRLFGRRAGLRIDLEAAQAAIQHGYGRARVIHRRRESPGSYFGKHNQPEPGVLSKTAVMLDQYRIAKGLRINCIRVAPRQIEQRSRRIDQFPGMDCEIDRDTMFFGGLL